MRWVNDLIGKYYSAGIAMKLFLHTITICGICILLSFMLFELARLVPRADRAMMAVAILALRGFEKLPYILALITLVGMVFGIRDIYKQRPQKSSTILGTALNGVEFSLLLYLIHQADL